MPKSSVPQNGDNPPISISETCSISQNSPPKDCDDNGNKTDFNVEKLTNPVGQMLAEREENRWSKRLQDQLLKKDSQCQKPAEGNHLSSNSFSALGSSEIIDRSRNMGVKMDETNFSAINLLCELENVKIMLKTKQNTTIPLVTDDLENSVPNLELDQMSISSEANPVQDEQVDWDDFILVTPKRCRKPPKKFTFSGTKKAKKSNKENPCSTSAKGVVCQGIPASTYPRQQKKKKRENMKGLFWNCRGIKRKGVSSFLRELILSHNFHVIGLQETMQPMIEDKSLRLLDPDQKYLWKWISSNGRSGGILSGINLEFYDVGVSMKANISCN